MRILFLDLDTLRPDHLSCYGYHRQTSPTIDSIAAQGVRFDNYYCSDAPCLPSRTALMTGRFGIHTGVVDHGGTAADLRPQGRTRGFSSILGWNALPAHLRLAGFKTVSISPFAERHSAWQFYAGFSEMYNTGGRGIESAEEVTPTVLDWIERNGAGDNWFLHVNYWDPHGPYRAPASFGNPFEKEPLPAWITDDVLAEHQQSIGPHTARNVNMYEKTENPKYPRYPGEVRDRAGLRRLFDGYDCGIRYMDDHIRSVLDALAAKGVLDDTAIIITADHGENLGELGIYVEHATADQITCHVPMIIRWPGCKAGHVDTGLHYNLDLVPTLAELLPRKPNMGKNPIPSPQWDGQSYAGALLEGKDLGREYLVVSQCAHVCQRGVRFGDWMYIRTYHDGYHLFPDEMLFNLADDPYEQKNIAAERREVCAQAVYHLHDWHDRMMMSMARSCTVDPLWTVIQEGGPNHANGFLADFCKTLEGTDRAWAIPELKKRHPREFE